MSLDSDYQLVPGMGTPLPGITNSIPQDAAPPYEDTIPPSHNIVISRNGDVYDNYKNRYAETHQVGIIYNNLIAISFTRC